MPPPTVRAVGALDDATPWAPAFPAGIVSGDILLWVGESVGGQNFTLPAGWAQVSTNGTPVSPVVQTTNTQLTVFWRRYDGTGSAPSVTGPADHGVTRMIAIAGCPATGNPWNVVAVGVDTVSDNSATFPNSVSTTVTDCLVLLIGAWSDDFAVAALPVNANLSSIAEHIDSQTATGNDGGIYLASGIKATTGTIGTSTATLGGVAFKAMMTLAMAPSAVVVPTLPLLMAPRIAR